MLLLLHNIHATYRRMQMTELQKNLEKTSMAPGEDKGLCRQCCFASHVPMEGGRERRRGKPIIFLPLLYAPVNFCVREKERGRRRERERGRGKDGEREKKEMEREGERGRKGERERRREGERKREGEREREEGSYTVVPLFSQFGLPPPATNCDCSLHFARSVKSQEVSGGHLSPS